MILREWRAAIRRDLRDEYVEYVRQTGIAGCRESPGKLGAWIAVRDLDDRRSEIVTLSLWLSLDRIAAFAGDAIETARYFPEDDKYLLTRPEHVVHYDTGIGQRIVDGPALSLAGAHQPVHLDSIVLRAISPAG